MFTEQGNTVSLNVIGLGARGGSWVSALADMADVRIAAICDSYEDRVRHAKDAVTAKKGTAPQCFTDYRELLATVKADACLVFTSWESHISIAIDCLKAGMRVGMEVGGANSVEECWALIHASETTGLPVMLLENCCFGREELGVLNMTHQGFFGEMVHCEGGYLHDLREEIGNGDVIRHYRQHHFANRNGELYPTHELGPIANLLKLNRGNRMLTLCAMASKAVGLRTWYAEHRADTQWPTSPIHEGDIVTTMIQCANGETITLKHDCSLPRPYSRGGLVQGTKGIWQEDNASVFLEGVSPVYSGDWTHRWEPFSKYLDQYDHPLWKRFISSSRTGGHGGMDYIVMRVFIDRVRRRAEFPIDVYDTAAWMAITALSEQSVAMGGAPVPIPDFTGGQWMQRSLDPLFTAS